eukprot:scaffold178726_cov31-Prasinocladus_malaysianus.AAC.1
MKCSHFHLSSCPCPHIPTGRARAVAATAARSRAKGYEYEYGNPFVAQLVQSLRVRVPDPLVWPSILE